jgi:hypothetical protein
MTISTSKLGRFAGIILAGGIFVTGAAAQQAAEVREDFELNIQNETISETDFRRSTNISVEQGNVKVQAGAAVAAARITMRLVNVTGRVRFFATTASLTDLLRRRAER